MLVWFKKVRENLHQNPQEHEQGWLRVAIGSIALVYFELREPNHAPDSFFVNFDEVNFLSLFVVISFGLIFHMGLYPENTYRKFLGAILDNLFCTIALSLTGEKGSVFFFVYLWVLVGNGVRFGKEAMLFSTFCAFLGVLSMTLYTSYWGNLGNLRFGLLLAITVPSIYLYVLLSRLERANQTLYENAQRFSRLAKRDSLTDLLNRFSLVEELESRWVPNKKDFRAFGLLYIDIDGFKEVNDQYGHQVGDLLLVAIAEELSATVRGSDIVARVGGDEFVVIVNNIEKETVLAQVAEKVNQAIRKISKVNSKPIKISASIGGRLVNWPVIGKLSVVEVVAYVDSAMYKAKKSGKNQYCVLAESA